jgi:anti-sigma B factor antagonist
MNWNDDGAPESINESLVSSITTSVARRDEIVLLTVGGDVDLSTAPTLERAIDAVLIGRPRAFIIDLSAVEFLGSAGLKLLAAANEKSTFPGRFGVVANNSAARRPIEVTQLDQFVSLFPTLDDAVTSLRSDTVS